MPLRLHTILKTALFAGLIAGLAFFCAQALTTRPIIVRAEIAERVQGDASHAQASHAHAAPTAAWEPADGVERTAYTMAADALVGIGYGFLLLGAIALSRRTVTARSGLLWGAAGFLAFAAAPALGLPPEPPGGHGADLILRQQWWLLTCAATGAGLWLMVLQQRTWLRLSGAMLLLLPHLIGAPRGEGVAAAPELLAPFVWASLAANAVLWLSLGLSIGVLLPRLAQERPVLERAPA